MKCRVPVDVQDIAPNSEGKIGTPRDVFLVNGHAKDGAINPRLGNLYGRFPLSHRRYYFC
jgi:hypothetical protein